MPDLDTHHAIEEVSKRTNLSVAACWNMFKAGYTYIEELGKPPRWEKP